MNIVPDDITCRMAFASYRNITIDNAERFAALGVDAKCFFAKPASLLAAITGARQSFFDDAKRAAALEAAVGERAFVESGSVKALYYSDEAFPQRLAQCTDGPAMLYVAGDPAAAAAPHSVAIVGTRHCTPYGADFTRRLVADLAARIDGLLIVSGLAYGVDICAHRAALEAGVPTGAVLAHGLNTVYPADHRADAQKIVRSGGFLATEYCSWSQIHRGNFLARNRIIAGLADVTVVVESDIKGGAMATARMAAGYDREVMALPGRVGDTYSRGCNELIASGGAALIREASDLIALMGWREKPAEGQQQELSFEIPASYRPVLDTLKARPEATVNDLCVALNLPFAHLSALLFKMELDDFIVALPGGRYALAARNR